MVFQFDYNDTYADGLADGWYEVVIQSATESATEKGSEYIDIPMVVRNDVPQNGKNGLIFHKIWKKKDTGKYNLTAINTLGKAAKMDATKQYKSLNEVLADLQGKALKVRVKNETSEYNGKTYENLNIKGMKETEFPNVQHVWKQKTTGNANPLAGEGHPININEDDLPF
nr:MAG TPA: Protein of unknown function (DUF669) [Caudoviricetes sp.]